MLFAFLPLTWALGVFGAAVSIPVIIHLINRKRFKIVPWAAMKFLLAAQKQTRKRMRIEQLLLLLCRMAILALVIFAMAAVTDWAEGYWAKLGLAEFGPRKRPMSQRTHHILVLDASLSMNQKSDGDQSAFEVAKQMALRKIADCSSGDGFSVLVLKDRPEWIVRDASQDQRKVSRVIEGIKPTHGNASLPGALSMVASKLAEGRARFPLQAVYFFTDMQKATWMGAAAESDGKEKLPYQEITEKATTIFVDCSPLKANNNLAVTNLEFDLTRSLYVTTGNEYTLKATVQNFGTEGKQVRAEVLIGKAKESAADSPLEMRVTGDAATELVGPNGAERVFKIDKIKFDKPGTYAVQVRLPEDSLVADNSRTVIITVRDTIPVLLVNGKSSPDPVERASEFLRLALNPFRVGDEPKYLPLRPTVVTPGQFSNMTDAELEPFDCIYFCDLPKIDPNALPRVDAHLRRGGGLMITLGPNAAGSLGNYNDVLYKDGHGLMPAELKKVVQLTPEHTYFLQSTDDDVYKHPPLAAFAADRDRLTLRTARFNQFVQAVVPEGKGRTLLDFLLEYTINDKVPRDRTLPDSGPAIVEWSPPLNRAHQPAVEVVKGQRSARPPLRYRGKVVLLTTAINTDWSNWPGSPSFVPMMHELTRLAVSGRLREQTQTVGSVLDGFLPGGTEVKLEVKFPTEYLKYIDAKTRTETRTKLIDGVNYFRFDEIETNYAGVYRVQANLERGKKDKKNDTETIEGFEIPYAINVPAVTHDQKYSESNLTPITSDELNNTYPGWKFQPFVRDPVLANINPDTVNPDADYVPQPVGPDLANIALLIVLGLMFLEVLLAWHFGHYTVTEGAVSQAAPSVTITAIAAGVAICAGLIVALGAAIIFHERQTGDLFGFLPDIVRSYIEQFMGIEPPLPGEGRNWNLESSQFLFGLPGGETSYAILLSLGALAMIFFTYRAEAPRVSLSFKLLLGAMRFCLILTCLWYLLPALKIQYARQGLPDLVLLIDDSGSMGTSDTFNDRKVIERVQELSKAIRERLDTELPDRLKRIQDDLAVKKPTTLKDPEGRPDLIAEVDALERRLAYWTKQQDDLRAGVWRPSRLQLVQAILAQKEPHWLKTLLTEKKSKVHVFHLDANGEAVKLRDLTGDAGEIISASDQVYLDRAEKAIKDLDATGKESRLGKAVRHVIDHYRGSSLSSVIMFTDGVTTRDETLAEAGAYAKSSGVSLFFVGVGDEKDVRALKLTELHVEDTIYKGDNAIFDVSIQGVGFKDLTVPVILKIIDEKTKKEIEVARVLGKVDPSGKPKQVPHLKHTPDKVGRIRYVVEIEQPKLELNEKPQPRSNLRLEKTVEVVELKTIRVLYVEDQPRYEFRYIKFLLEREFDDKAKKQPADKNKPKAIELKVLLLDADKDFHKTDEHAIEHFPPTIDDLLRYDVLIIGDCNPRHEKLKHHLKDIKAYAQGVTEDGKKLPKAGGGVLFIAGAFNNPHKFKTTPLEDILPVEPLQGAPPPEVARTVRYRPELTPLGRNHPIFKFGADDNQSGQIWGNLSQIYWYSSKYRAKPTARVFATHPEMTEDGKKIPLVVETFVGSSRSMFFGFDETWRWRKAGEEKNFNRFWVETMRFLAHGRSMHTKLVLDRQTPYTVGEKITVKVTFPESTPGGVQQGPKIDDKTEVKVKYEFVPLDAAGKLDPEVKDMANLTKVAGSTGTYEGTLPSALVREGKYRFRLWQPDVSNTQPDREKPSAEAVVNPLPGELDNLRMDYYEMRKAADLSSGEFYTIATADKLLVDIPAGTGLAIASNMPPTLLWNQFWVLGLVVLLITSEWVLRKVKHLL